MSEFVSKLTKEQLQVKDSVRKVRLIWPMPKNNPMLIRSWTKEWEISPLVAKYPVLNIEYPFDMPEEELVAGLKLIRKEFNIPSAPTLPDRNDSLLASAYKRRNNWINTRYSVLSFSREVLIDKKIKYAHKLKIYEVIQKDLNKMKKKNPFNFPSTHPKYYCLRLDSIKRILRETKPKT